MATQLNTYKDIDNETVEMTITSKKGETKVLIDKKYEKYIMRKMWFVSAKEGMVVAMKNDGGRYLKNVVAELSNELSKRVSFINGDVFDIRLQNLKNNVTVNHTKVWEKGMEKRYSKDWSMSLANKVHKTAKITQTIADNIRETALRGVTQTELAIMFGIKRSTVADVLNFRTWNEFLVKSDITSMHTEELEDNSTHFDLTDDDTHQDINAKKLLQVQYRTFLSTDGVYDIKMVKLSELQFYLEYYHKGTYIGASQHMVNNPYTPAHLVKWNNTILLVKKDTFGYAKEHDTILTRNQIYKFLNGINNTISK